MAYSGQERGYIALFLLTAGKVYIHNSLFLCIERGYLWLKRTYFRDEIPRKSSIGRQKGGQKPLYHLLLTHPIALQISSRLAFDNIVTYSAIIGFIRSGRRIPPKGSQTSQDAHDVGRLQAPFTAAGLFRRYDHRPSTPYKNSEDKIEDKKEKKKSKKNREKKRLRLENNTIYYSFLYFNFYSFI